MTDDSHLLHAPSPLALLDLLSFSGPGVCALCKRQDRVVSCRILAAGRCLLADVLAGIGCWQQWGIAGPCDHRTMRCFPPLPFRRRSCSSRRAPANSNNLQRPGIPIYLCPLCAGWRRRWGRPGASAWLLRRSREGRSCLARMAALQPGRPTLPRWGKSSRESGLPSLPPHRAGVRIRITAWVRLGWAGATASQHPNQGAATYCMSMLHPWPAQQPARRHLKTSMLTLTQLTRTSGQHSYQPC